MSSALYVFVLCLAVARPGLCSEGDAEKDFEDLRNHVISPIEVNNLEYTLIPGELSPLVPCIDCYEKRTKRSIPNIIYARHFDNPRNRCPKRYHRMGFWCVPF